MGGILESNGDVYKELTEMWSAGAIHLSTIPSIHPIHLSTTQDAFETKSGLMSSEKDVVLTTVKTAILLVQTPAGKLY